MGMSVNWHSQEVTPEQVPRPTVAPGLGTEVRLWLWAPPAGSGTHCEPRREEQQLKGLPFSSCLKLLAAQWQSLVLDQAAIPLRPTHSTRSPNRETTPWGTTNFMNMWDFSTGKGQNAQTLGSFHRTGSTGQRCNYGSPVSKSWPPGLGDKFCSCSHPWNTGWSRHFFLVSDFAFVNRKDRPTGLLGCC